MSIETFRPRPPRRLWLVLAALLAGAAMAQEWLDLEPEVRALLEPVRTAWDALPAAERRRIHDQASRWLAASPAQRDVLRERYRGWLERSAAERLDLRQRLLAWETLGEDERAALREARARFESLPEAERNRLRARFAELTPAQRRAFLLPAAQREAADLALRLFPYVPESEREETLQMLSALGEEGRAALDARSRRLSPVARDALRRDLLALPPEQRLARLR